MNLVETARLLYTSGLNTSYQGVLAARLGERNLICITAAKSDFKSIERQDICLLNLAGEVVNGPSLLELPANLKFYLKVFQDRADVKVLAHVYPPHARGFAEKSQMFELLGNPDKSEVRELIKVECLECPSRFTGLCSCRNEINWEDALACDLIGPVGAPCIDIQRRIEASCKWKRIFYG